MNAIIPTIFNFLDFGWVQQIFTKFVNLIINLKLKSQILIILLVIPTLLSTHPKTKRKTLHSNPTRTEQPFQRSRIRLHLRLLKYNKNHVFHQSLFELHPIRHTYQRSGNQYTVLFLQVEIDKTVLFGSRNGPFFKS